jgi:hypothetical protein
MDIETQYRLASAIISVYDIRKILSTTSSKEETETRRIWYNEGARKRLDNI